MSDVDNSTSDNQSPPLNKNDPGSKDTKGETLVNKLCDNSDAKTKVDNSSGSEVPKNLTAPHDDAADNSVEKISKNQLKKRRRLERAKEHKAKRKREAKEAKRAKAIADGRDLDAERKLQEERTKSGEGRRKREELWNDWLKTAEKSFGVCIDCSFEDKMTEKEINSLSQQIRYAYANNKRSPNPCSYYVSSLSGETFKGLAKVAGFPENWESRAFKCSDKSLLDMFPDKGKLVYLTSDSDNEIQHLDDNKIYVIGGIVDRNRLKRIAFNRAEELGIETAKLPIASHLKLSATNVLTCNHVFEILLKYREYGNDWGKAMFNVLPQRKDLKVIDDKTTDPSLTKDICEGGDAEDHSDEKANAAVSSSQASNGTS